MGATICRLLNLYMRLNRYRTFANGFIPEIVEAPFRPTGGMMRGAG